MRRALASSLPSQAWPRCRGVRKPLAVAGTGPPAYTQALRSLKKTRMEVEMLAEQLAQVGLPGACLARRG